MTKEIEESEDIGPLRINLNTTTKDFDNINTEFPETKDAKEKVSIFITKIRECDQSLEGISARNVIITNFLSNSKEQINKILKEISILRAKFGELLNIQDQVSSIKQTGVSILTDKIRDLKEIIENNQKIEILVGKIQRNLEENISDIEEQEKVVLDQLQEMLTYTNPEWDEQKTTLIRNELQALIDFIQNFSTLKIDLSGVMAKQRFLEEDYLSVFTKGFNVQLTETIQEITNSCKRLTREERVLEVPG